MVFKEVDPSLKLEWTQKDGDYVHKGLQYGKVYGRTHSIVVAERVVLNFMQKMSGIATLTKEGHIKMLSSYHSPSVPELKLLKEGNFLKAWGDISSLQVRLWFKVPPSLMFGSCVS